MSANSTISPRGFLVADNPSVPFSLRLATPSDVPALRELIPVAVRGLSAGFYSPEQIEASLIHVFGIDTRLIEDATYFVAEEGGQIAGAGGWSRRRTLFGGDQRQSDRADDRLDPSTDAARIRAFYVHPDRARRGIGRAILSACEEAATAEGFRRFELVAAHSSVPLYAALGYAEIEPIEIAMEGAAPLLAVRTGKRRPRASR